MLMSVCIEPQTVNRFVKIQSVVLNVIAVKVSTCNQMENLVKVSKAYTVSLCSLAFCSNMCV